MGSLVNDKTSLLFRRLFFSLTFRSINTECYLPHTIFVLFCCDEKNGPQKCQLQMYDFWETEKKMEWMKITWNAFIIHSFSFFLCVVLFFFFFFCSFDSHLLHSRLILPLSAKRKQEKEREKELLIVQSKVGFCVVNGLKIFFFFEKSKYSSSGLA